MAVPDPARSRAGRHRPVDSRDLAGARDIASVVDARIRQHGEKRRIGQFADDALLWAITALSPCPQTRPPVDNTAWQQVGGRQTSGGPWPPGRCTTPRSSQPTCGPTGST